MTALEPFGVRKTISLKNEPTVMGVRLLLTSTLAFSVVGVRHLPEIVHLIVCVCVCVFFPFILDIKFVGRTSRGHTGGRSHRISHPPSFRGACLNFSREKDSAIPLPRRPSSRNLCTNDLIVLHPLGIFSFSF